MTALLVVIVAALVVIAAATLIGPRLGIAAPLVLVAAGVAASFLPAFGDVTVQPQWILEGILPPLLYSSAVSMPAMNFRREFRAISGLSILLVVASALALGVFFMLVLPNVGFAWGVALGAVISPTDAVATSIIKKANVSKRVVAMLDGESLLNDATALVLLRTAIVAGAAAFSFWGAIGTFAFSVVVALLIGGAVGVLGLLVRKRISDPTVSTLISFAIPFAASVPAEVLGASGLVAAVVAGLITGVRAPRDLSPQTRLADTQNWRTVEMVLEGAVFLTMGIQIRPIVVDVQHDHGGIGVAVLIAAGALVLTLLIRGAYVIPLLLTLRARASRMERSADRYADLKQNMSTETGRIKTLERANARGGRKVSDRDLDRFSVRLTRGLADIEYFRREPLGWREGVLVVWAGMRGAVTVAAAQTLTAGTPDRSALVLIAFVVAALSLLVQGGTVGSVVRWLTPQPGKELAATADEDRRRLGDLMRSASEAIPAPPRPDPDSYDQADFEAARTHRIAVLDAQRRALLDARDNGTFDAEVLESVLANLDASQIAIEMRASMTG